MTDGQRTFPVSSSSNAAKQSGQKLQVQGANKFLGATYYSSHSYYAFIKATIASSEWSDVASIKSAYLVVRVPDDAKDAFKFGAPKANSGVYLTMLSETFPDNTSGSFVDHSADLPTKRTTPAPLARTIQNTIGVDQRIDITTILEYLAPSTVKTHTGAACKGVSNYGIQISYRKTSKQADPTVVLASERYLDTPAQPYIELNYVAKPGPGNVFITAPDAVDPIVQIEGQYFEGDFIASQPLDAIDYVDIQVYPSSVDAADYDTAGTKATGWNPDVIPATPSWHETNHFAIPLPETLKSATSYNWRVRVKYGSTWTSWAGPAALRISTGQPLLDPSSLTPAGPYKTLVGVLFQAHYSDPNSNALTTYRIQVRDQTSPTDPDWDGGLLYWDTGDRPASDSESEWAYGPIRWDVATWDGAVWPELRHAEISVLYGGEALDIGTYSYRISASDTYGARSDWQYGSFSITEGEVPDPGGPEDPDQPPDYLSGYARRHVRARIVIRDMVDPTTGLKYANRRPSRVVAIIEDASNIGASEYYNSGGEFYFTLPAVHPQAGVIEPWQVHYAVEVYRGSGWTEVTAGLITDFDATADDVVFYGVDYLGILGYLVDSRFSATAADSPAGIYPAAAGGSKYTDKQIDVIVKDQLQRAIHGTDSPLGFFTLGTVAAMVEKITIFSTFKQRLPFVAGLIDSHRGSNVGTRTRLRVRKTVADGYQFVVEANPGRDRDNLRMEYGGLVQAMRVLPFGDFGTRVFAIGRPVEGTKVEYLPNTLGVANEQYFGQLPKVNIWQDITDRADLKRRATLYARSISKVGKRLGLGLRVDVLSVKDGWDITDSVYVDVDRGVVETLRYGSGYWTIWGWSFQVFPDGHTDLVLTLLPKLDEEGPDADLIPSDPIHTTPEWAIASGPPDHTTFAMVATETYVDADTGTVYKYDSVKASGTTPPTPSLASPASRDRWGRQVLRDPSAGPTPSRRPTRSSRAPWLAPSSSRATARS